MAHVQSPARLLSSRAVVGVSPRGPAEECGAGVQGLVTNDVAGDLPVWAGLLTAQGKALFDFMVWRDRQDLLIDGEDAAADALIRRLSIYRLRRRIAIARDPALGVFWQASDTGLPDAARPDPRLAALGWRWIGPVAAADGDAEPAWLAHRLALGVTEGVAELGSDATLWLETNADDLNGVSFTKGCYVGQENTARMNWRQKVNRRLVVVPIDQSRADRQRVTYPALGLAVDHRRVEQIDPATAPGWMQITAES